ncbi:unnamed protein product [Rotaria sp. Silwood1]|nr:unnamed protein product [Rotaria sp. Silwood1]CAF1585873.1 unnamed protein product [Rotaria sp. Silwood1]CAF3611821.1 unnamed protein product [Rotaria sp. Silwood1]CAF3647275.1 unnamed protein product [Rotaria sp. Silwood1]CAF3679900.1 unnamed protein product [Rotaria sp. Silwood1]
MVSELPLNHTTSNTSSESNWKNLRMEIYSVGVYDLHNVLRRRNILDWCEWHLTIDENDNAIKIAKEFHQEFEKSRLSSNLAGKIDTIEKTFLNFMPHDNDWNKIRKCFQDVRQEDSPLPIIKAYTLAQDLTVRLNKHSAVNTYHALKLYCTLLNCPILAQTQEYTEAITSLFFHPKLDEFLVRNITVHRGIFLKDKKLIADYSQGATIITTTFLSTTTDPVVAECFCAVPPEDMISISVFCTYNINNTHRRTALRLKEATNFEDEQEVLILRYIPFTIKSIERTNDGRKIRICFDECKD